VVLSDTQISFYLYSVIKHVLYNFQLHACMYIERAHITVIVDKWAYVDIAYFTQNDS